MKIILHIPKDKEKLNELSSKVAKIYGSAIKHKVENLKCSKNQKIKLLDEIIKSYNKAL
ncbi:MAG: hypothetical protein IJC57_00425 [Clostridia bacterium]|nr:hypothetical protein [Clostridia bacterium]